MVERKKTGLRKARAAVSTLFPFLPCPEAEIVAENLGQAVEYTYICILVHYTSVVMLYASLSLPCSVSDWIHVSIYNTVSTVHFGRVRRY